MDDYAFSKLRERYKKWTGNSFEDKDLISFGLVNEQGELTNAGALLADESPVLCSRLFCTRWNGLNKSGGTVDALDDAKYSGSVISLIENGEAFIKRNCKMKWRKTANSREDMPDGSIIQDRDPLMVPSTRRNPVLADVFNRLGYMERKGSGFGKIISGYEFQINYNESKRPSFRSDRYQFTVVMPNLNYDVPQDVPQDKLNIQILDLIRKDSKISTEKMAIALDVSSKTIKRHIKEMDNVRYIGRGFSGHWEIIETE
ncbi:ATP-binding protein [Lachnospiraceae bacterium 48-42]